jgi:hypothetical protein
MFHLDQIGIVEKFTEVLQAECIDAAGVCNSCVPDWYIYAHWKHVIEKKPHP